MANTTTATTATTTTKDISTGTETEIVVKEAKPGWRTTEFWLGMAAMILTGLYASGAIPTSGTVATAIAMIATVLGALGYTVSRGMAKSK